MAVILEDKSLANRVTRVEVFLAPLTCHHDETEIDSVLCTKEDPWTGEITTRFYDIEVSATDAAGNVGTKTCSVIVVPPDHYKCNSNGSSSSSSSSDDGDCAHDENDLRRQYESSIKRRVISELEVKWDPELDTSILFPIDSEFDASTSSSSSRSSKGHNSRRCGCSSSKSSKGKGSRRSRK